MLFKDTYLNLGIEELKKLKLPQRHGGHGGIDFLFVGRRRQTKTTQWSLRLCGEKNPHLWMVTSCNLAKSLSNKMKTGDDWNSDYKTE
jgi:hypothetical protein